MMAQASPSNHDLMDAVAHLSRESFQDDEYGRLLALSKARSLVQRLETPWDALNVRYGMLRQPSVSVAIKIGQDLNLFAILPPSPELGCTVTELAEKTKSDPNFLSRILRLLASSRYIEETETRTFRGTELSRAFAEPGFVGGMQHLFTQILPVFQNLPEYMSQTQYKLPDQPEDGPFQSGVKESKTFFEWLKSHPSEGRGFNDLMALNHEETNINWVNIFPVAQLVEDIALKSEGPLVVDVGGGIGRDMENLKQKLLPKTYPIMVQDLDHVIQQGQSHGFDQSITYLAHDFFQKQPIQGARAYFMHGCLHDWPDNLALEILKHLEAAMDPGYSKLLVCENIQPERVEQPHRSGIDLVMLGLLSAKERTKAEWSDLLNAAGFRIVKVWGDCEVTQCVIEAETLRE